MKKYLLIFLLIIISCKNQDNNTPTTNNGNPPTIETSSLKIGSFNIQIFGLSKMGKPDVVTNLIKILNRYDIVLIQEIRDSSGTAITDLLNQINQNNGNKFSMTIGSREGRTSSKEQYAFFYNKNKIEVVDQFEYDDGVEPSNDSFEREPLLVYFNSKNTNTKFFIAGIHTSPSEAFAEIQSLEDVYWSGVNKWGEYNGIIMGDLNADCSYLSDTEYSTLYLKQDSRFNWAFSKAGDSTVSPNTNCQYDNLITSTYLTDHIVPNSAKVFNFQSEYGLNQTLSEDISDHFPIEISLDFQ